MNSPLRRNNIPQIFYSPVLVAKANASITLTLQASQIRDAISHYINTSTLQLNEMHFLLLSQNALERSNIVLIQMVPQAEMPSSLI